MVGSAESHPVVLPSFLSSQKGSMSFGIVIDYSVLHFFITPRSFAIAIDCVSFCNCNWLFCPKLFYQGQARRFAITTDYSVLHFRRSETPSPKAENISYFHMNNNRRRPLISFFPLNIPSGNISFVRACIFIFPEEFW